jgi:tetratricopeptide (TPR) repeat protein
MLVSMKNLLVLFFLLFAVTAKADDNLLLMEQANSYYNEGEYHAAIEVYEAVLDNGYESAALYYNLGNAYFKINNMAAAILHYERAKKIAPFDKDIRFNLEIANSRIVDKIEPVPELFIYRWWDQLVSLQSPEAWAWISVFSFSVLLLMVLVFLLSKIVWLKKATFWLGIVFLGVFAITVIISNQRHKALKQQNEGIVFTPTLNVKSSPRENSTDIFVIHEGTKVTITKNLDGWYEIRIADGSKGWIRENDFEKI